MALSDTLYYALANEKEFVKEWFVIMSWMNGLLWGHECTFYSHISLSQTFVRLCINGNVMNLVPPVGVEEISVFLLKFFCLQLSLRGISDVWNMIRFDLCREKFLGGHNIWFLCLQSASESLWNPSTKHSNTALGKPFCCFISFTLCIKPLMSALVYAHTHINTNFMDLTYMQLWENVEKCTALYIIQSIPVIGRKTVIHWWPV